MHTCEEINKKHKRDMDEVEGGTCYWANLLPELLREVLIKLEKSESKWPARKNVVVCAGVCKSWRQIIKELVKTLEVSGKITFPISVKQPGPRESCVQCFVKRNRATQMHYLYLSLSEALADDGKFLLAARRFRRPRFTEYIISLHPLHICRSNGFYIGKLRSNFLGNKFVVYDALPPHAGAKLQTRFTQNVGLRQISPRIPAGNYPVAQITYEMNVLGARNPRRIHCIMDAIPASAIKPGGVAPTQIDFTISNADSFSAIPFSGSKSNGVNKSQSTPLDDGERGPPLVLKNEAPRWNQQLHCWCLNFHGRVTVASVKNFQLVASPENGLVGAEKEKIFLQFGKVGKDVFTMDYCYPLSAFQAFAISLSSFDTKSTCE